MTLDPVDRRYVEVARRSASRVNATALGIVLLIVATSATSWERFGFAVAAHAIILPLNIVLTAVVVPRLGARAELLRMVLNGLFSGFAYVVIDWPLPVWLWLPYMAVTFDPLGGKHTMTMLVVTCLLQDGFALLDGVPPLIPLVFTVFAGICWLVTDARQAIIRDMLERSEQQRDELERAHELLKVETATRMKVESELQQAHKFEAIGRLASGIAHEINTPMQFIGDSIAFVREGVGDLLQVVHAEAGADEDVAYLAERVPKALALAADGCARVATIVRSMKQLAYTGPQHYVPLDLNAAVQSALTLTRTEYVRVAEVTTHLTALPSIRCNAREIGQVLLDLIVNAGHAIEERVGTTGELGRIGVSTHANGAFATVSISDTGTGMTEAVRARIFDPFFTTKAVGKGIGQGLAVSRALVERHGGTLTCETVLGSGTTFQLTLPVSEVQREAA
ncbi:MAG: ATP-binding protein [Kofleriaceae bacterium]